MSKALPPSVTELANDTRYAQVPKELRRKDLSPKGHKGLCVGRDEILDGLADYFITQWRSSTDGELRDEDCVASVITNAPGAGKSTVAEEFAIRHAAKGVAVIEIDGAELATERQLIKALRGYAEQGELAKPIECNEPVSLMRKVVNWLLYSRATPLVAGAGALGLTGGNVIAGAGATAGVTAVQEALDKFRTRIVDNGDPGLSAEDALKALNETHGGKFIVLVDECHELANPKLQTPELIAHIGHLAKPRSRQKLGIRGGGMLFAGLGSFPDDLDGLGLTRAKVEWLGELDGESAERIVRHYLANTPLRSGRKGAIAPTWVPRLAHAFSHWPQHSAAAGVFASELLKATDKAPAPPDDPAETELLEHVITLTARDIQRLYQSRITNAKNMQPNIEAAAIAAMANLTNNQIPQNALVALIGECLQEGKVQVTVAAERECIRDLKRAGLCRDLWVTEDGRRADYYAMGMPSLRRFISENAAPARIRKWTERAQEIISRA